MMFLTGELQAHLQEMANLLRDEDTMRLVMLVVIM